MKGKLLLSVATAALIVTGFTGCDVGKSTSTDSGQIRQIHAPKGTVVGVVTDTNGNPLQGVKVYLNGKETTTDASGTYKFTDVTVVNAAADDATAGNGNLVVVIKAPEGYLGATVTVTPQAQVNHSEGNNGNPTTTGEHNPNTVFIDGFTASAGQVALPKLDAKVKGVLRDRATESPIPAHEVALDFQGVTGVSPDSNINKGVVISYATPVYKTVTDENGVFEFTNLPEDSTFKVVVPDYTVATITNNGGANQNSQFKTTDEVAELNLGNVEVNPIVATDNIKPYVAGVKNQAACNNNRAILDDNTYNDFTIEFSEPINKSAVNDNSILVYNETNQTYIKDFTYDISEDGKSLTIHLAQDLEPGTNFDIYLLKPDFKDLAGNILDVNNKDNFNADISPNNNNYVEVQLQTFKEANIATETPTLIQTDEDKDYVQDDTLAKLRNYSEEFKDNYITTTPDKIVEQLNNADANLLTDLARTISGDKGVSVETNVTRVEFDLDKVASSYDIEVKNKSGNIVNGAIVKLADGTYIGKIDNNTTLNTDKFVTGHNAIVIFGVSAGDKVIITPKDDFGNKGEPAEITLKDTIAPIPVLQDAFGTGKGSTYQAGKNPYGDGAELSYVGEEAKIGTPYLPITAGLIDNDKDHTISDITKYNTKNSETDTYYVDSKNEYDANAFANAPKVRVIGVGFAEPIDLNGTPNFNGTTELSNWKTLNGLTQQFYGGTPYTKDLAIFEANDIFNLANIDNNKVIDFTNVVSDKAGNVATANYNAKVVVQDQMPPMVTYSFLDLANGSTQLQIKFNEPIQLKVDKNNPLVSLNGKDFYYVANTKKYVVLSDDKKTLTIDLAGFEFDKNGNIQNINLGLNNTHYSYVESAYGKDKVAHFDLDFKYVKDLAGNNWQDNNSTIYSRPQFLSANSWVDFDSNGIATHFNSGDDTTKVAQTVTWKLTHPLNIKEAEKLCDSGKLTVDNNNANLYGYCSLMNGAQVVEYDGTNNTTLTEGNLTISSDFRTLTLTFKTKDDVTSPNAYLQVTANNGKVVSEIDGASTTLDNVEAK